MHIEINVFEKPLERIKRTSDLMGMGADFERKLPELETHLEGLVADGETDEERLTVSGLTFLKRAKSRPLRRSPKSVSSRSLVGPDSEQSERTGWRRVTPSKLGNPISVFAHSGIARIRNNARFAGLSEPYKPTRRFA